LTLTVVINLFGQSLYLGESL